MKRKRLKIAGLSLALISVLLLLVRHDIAIAYHRWNFNSEYEAWRHPKVTHLGGGLYGQKRPETTAIESRLAKLEQLGAVRRIDHILRNELDAETYPEDFKDRLETGSLPKHLHLDILGNVRSAQQRLVVWCNVESVNEWNSYLKTDG